MTPANCDLCGLPLRYGAVSHHLDGQAMAFCCQGCRMVYTMLLEAIGTDDPARFRQSDLYRQCLAAGVIPATEDDLRRLKEQETAQREAADPAAGMTDRGDTLALDLKIEGMWCTACAWVIERSISRLAGIRTVTCNFSTDRLRCRYRPDRIAPDQIRDAVVRLGYAPRDADDGSADHHTRRRELIRLTITGLLSANVMMLSWALYAGFFTALSRDAVSKISLPIVVMATAAVVYGGGPMLRKAWSGLIHGMPGMETLVGAGAGCAYAYSLYNWLNGSIHLYFDTACMLITLVLLGKFLERQAKDRVRRDLDSFFDLQPTKVRLVTAAAPSGRYVAIGQLAPGDRFAVETDEIVPADGRVTSGRARLDESSLTGEPRPVSVKPGDPVKSGTRLIDGRVTATAEKVADDTILGQMIAIMSRSLAQKSRFETRTDRLLQWFVPVIMALAAGTGLVGALTGLPLHQAVVRAVTVMVISCPCALGVAIPMARLAGISLSGRRGILVREFDAFEHAGGIDTIVFDKTGTLTLGRWQLSRVACAPQQDPAAVVSWAAGLEQGSQHEIARAIEAHARSRGIAAAPVTDLTTQPDGVQGRVNGTLLRIGSRAFAWGDHDDPPWHPASVDDRLTSHVFLGVAQGPAASLAFGDAVRSDVPAMIAKLRRDGFDLHLISGDGHDTTLAVGGAVGLSAAQGSLLPTDKADYIDVLCGRGRRVAMVGDGVNDAAAMARAHLAVAVYTGAGLAKAAAHITLMRGDPTQLLGFFPLAEQVNRKVVQNLWCAWIYNLISIPVAMSGLLTPLVAATAMLLSSLTVIGNTLLLLRQD
jgi:heavy metal translocating P-type ATPase